jgi:hypothetical protein
MTQLFYKERTSVSLNNILLSNPYFAEHWKLIPLVIKFLNQLLRWNHADNGFSSITYRRFEARFHGEAIPVRDALESLGLLMVIRTWRKKGTNDKDDTGKCYDYYLTPKCQRALADANRQYLYLLLTDKPTKRRNQKQISKRGHKIHGDVRDILKATVDGITIDLNQVEKVVAKMPDGKAAFVWSLLVNIVRKDYSELAYNVKDGRVCTPYAQLPAEIRAIVKINDLIYQKTIDIRSCYPSLWAEYVITLCHDDPKSQAERARWNNLFLNPDLDPKAVVAKSIGVSRDAIKEVMIQYFNGKIRGKAFKAFDGWISHEFPNLYTAWKKTDIKQTGNNIGKYFETRLTLNKSIYEKAKELGVIIGYEYDGFSFFAKDDSNCDALLTYIEQRSVELLGVKLVFVDKTTDLIAYMAMGETDMLQKRVEDMNAKMKLVRMRCWRNGKDWKPFNDVRDVKYKLTDDHWKYTKAWAPYYALRDNRDGMLERLKELQACME